MSAIDKIEEMVTIQNGLNTKSYDTSWLEKGRTGEFDYAIAAGQEIGEFLDSLPFSWWTGGASDRQNCVTELVDAWHFVMSQVLIDCDGGLPYSIKVAGEGYDISDDFDPADKQDTMEIKKLAKKLVVSLYVGAHPSVYVKGFFDLCSAYGVSIDLLYARYIAKATLNKFRVENGYKVKEYAKLWDFGGEPAKLQEDNFHLSTWIDHNIASGSIPSADMVHSWLTQTYAKVVNNPRLALASTASDEHVSI